MNNIKRIQKLLNDHFLGEPWIDTNVLGTLKSITAKQATEKHKDFNSIWQIVNHMILWRLTLLKRLKDKSVIPPKNNFISEVKDTSPKAWKETIKKFERSQKNIISFLGKSKDELLKKISPTSGYSYYELVMAIVIHDTYHLGQIVLLKKMTK